MEFYRTNLLLQLQTSPQIQTSRTKPSLQSMTTIWSGPIPNRVNLGREGYGRKYSVFTANRHCYIHHPIKLVVVPAFPGSLPLLFLTSKPTTLPLVDAKPPPTGRRVQSEFRKILWTWNGPVSLTLLHHTSPWVHNQGDSNCYLLPV